MLGCALHTLQVTSLYPPRLFYARDTVSVPMLGSMAEWLPPGKQWSHIVPAVVTLMQFLNSTSVWLACNVSFSSHLKGYLSLLNSSGLSCLPKSAVNKSCPQGHYGCLCFPEVCKSLLPLSTYWVHHSVTQQTSLGVFAISGLQRLLRAHRTAGRWCPLRGGPDFRGIETLTWRGLFWNRTLSYIHKIKSRASEGACASDGPRGWSWLADW